MWFTGSAGFGKFSTVTVPQDTAELQVNLIRSHAIAWPGLLLPRRAIMLLRVNVLARGIPASACKLCKPWWKCSTGAFIR